MKERAMHPIKLVHAEVRSKPTTSANHSKNKYISKRNSKPKSSQLKIPKPKSYLTGNCIKRYKELYL